MFLDTVITFSEHTRKPKFVAAKPEIQPAASLGFTPRNARKGKTLGKGRGLQPDHVAPAAVTGQDAFRALVESKNKKREENLTAKRTAEEAGPEAKRTRTE